VAGVAARGSAGAEASEDVVVRSPAWPAAASVVVVGDAGGEVAGGGDEQAIGRARLRTNGSNGIRLRIETYGIGTGSCRTLAGGMTDGPHFI